MRVAFFSTLMNAPWGGSEVLWHHTALYMEAQGHEVAVFVKQWEQEHSAIKDLRAAGIPIFYHTSFRKTSFLSKVSGKLRESLFVDQSLSQRLLKWKPAFIFFSQSHSYDLGYFPARQLAPLLKANIPYAVICQNNSEYNFVPETNVRQQIKEVYEKAKAVFFVSERNLQTAEKIICRKINNARIISNSIGLAPEEIGILPYPENDEAQFASVARLRCSHKGQNLLIDVLSQKKWLDRKWVLNLYGNGEDESYLKELVSFSGLAERIFFHGQVKNIRKVWEQNQLFLLASFGEGMPLALQEAMLCGRAAVVTDVGGNSELIEDGLAGWLAGGAAFAAFDAAMEKAWQSRGTWKEAGEKAFEKINSCIDLFPGKTLMQFSESIIKA